MSSILPFYGLFLAQIVSSLSHNARIAPLFADNLLSKTASKSDNANY